MTEVLPGLAIDDDEMIAKAIEVNPGNLIAPDVGER